MDGPVAGVILGGAQLILLCRHLLDSAGSFAPGFGDRGRGWFGLA